MPPKCTNPLPVNEIKKLKAVLKARSGQAGIDELASEYSQGSTEEKRLILNRFIADGTLSFRHEISQDTRLSRTESSSTIGRWLTLKQIAQREGMQLDDPHLQLVVKDLKERDHVNPALAAEGVKQYRTEKQKEEVANAHEEATTFRNTAAGMERVKKAASASNSGAAGPSTNAAGGLQVNWTTALKGVKKNITGGLKEAMNVMSSAQKHRSSIESASDKMSLKDAQKILQECIEATEDIVAASADTELDHERLKDCLQALLRTTMAFKDVLYHVAPKAKPVVKESK